MAVTADEHEGEIEGEGWERLGAAASGQAERRSRAAHPAGSSAGVSWRTRSALRN